MRGDDRVRRDATYRQLAEAAADNRLADAARAFHGLAGTADEMSALDTHCFDQCAASVLAWLRAGRDAATYRGPASTDLRRWRG